MPIVSVIQAGKSFGAERIFEGVNFQIDEHDRIGLVGPNGAGKTTLLNLLAGREEADEGNIALARNIRIGYLTQIPGRPGMAGNLLEWLERRDGRRGPRPLLPRQGGLAHD